jgi:hypothetical protein
MRLVAGLPGAAMRGPQDRGHEAMIMARHSCLTSLTGTPTAPSAVLAPKGDSGPE